MKRSQLKVGEAYALLSPSQTIGESRPARRVIIVSTSPVREQFRASFSSTPEPRTTITVDGETVEAIDRTRATNGGSLVAAAESQTYVNGKVWVVKPVPVSQVRMLWTEYEAKLAEARERRTEERRRAAEFSARRQEQAEVILGLAAKLGVRIDPRVTYSGHEMAMRYDDAEALLKRLAAAESAR